MDIATFKYVFGHKPVWYANRAWRPHKRQTTVLCCVPDALTATIETRYEAVPEAQDTPASQSQAAPSQHTRTPRYSSPRYSQRGPYKSHGRRPRTPEVRQKISDAMKGHPVTETTRTAMSRAKQGRKMALGTRVKQSDAATARGNVPFTAAVRRKLSERKKEFWARQRELRQVPSATSLEQSAGGQGSAATAAVQENTPGRPIKKVLADPLVLERAVAEVVTLRRQLLDWMQHYESVFGDKPDMEQVAQDSPQVYQRFIRYMALRDYVRASNR